MATGEIPINPLDLPTEQEPMATDVVYTGVVRKQGKAIDKNENDYLNISVEVTEPEEWAGKRVGHNYIPFPRPVTDRMSAGQRRSALESGVDLARLCRSAGYTRPFTVEDPPDFIGSEIRFTVINEPHYQNPTRLVPKIQNFVFDE